MSKELIDWLIECGFFNCWRKRLDPFDFLVTAGVEYFFLTKNLNHCVVHAGFPIKGSLIAGTVYWRWLRNTTSVHPANTPCYHFSTNSCKTMVPTIVYNYYAILEDEPSLGRLLQVSSGTQPSWTRLEATGIFQDTFSHSDIHWHTSRQLKR